MTFFMQLVVSGIGLGMIYALIALGFVIILKCSKAFNIAQGQFVMLGGYLGYTFILVFHLPAWAALAGAIAIGIVLGLAIERLALRPLVGQSVLSVIMMTIALSTVLEGVGVMIWGGIYEPYKGGLPTFNIPPVAGVSISPETLDGIILSAIVVIALMAIFRYTKTGLAMRATAEDEKVVQSSGIKVTTVYAVSWIIACVVGVVSGMLLYSISGVQQTMSDVGLKAFGVVLLGGVDSIGGAIIAGLIVGILENVAAGYLDPLLPTGGGLASVFPFIVMIIVLIFKPHGLFGTARIERI
ncbi:MAG TPA: branched-chain amino acid ABC transporter permease [Dehalococcoidales bacterium]|nr:branched-chain amino acid ABC transporter permease [Dehalococcoidales bacterium]